MSDYERNDCRRRDVEKDSERKRERKKVMEIRDGNYVKLNKCGRGKRQVQHRVRDEANPKIGKQNKLYNN